MCATHRALHMLVPRDLSWEESRATACRWGHRPSVVRLDATGNVPVAFRSWSRWVPSPTCLRPSDSRLRRSHRPVSGASCRGPGSAASKRSTWPESPWRSGDRSPREMNQRCARRAEDVKCNRWACQTAWAAQHVPMLIAAALRDVVIRLNAMQQKALDRIANCRPTIALALGERARTRCRPFSAPGVPGTKMIFRRSTPPASAATPWNQFQRTASARTAQEWFARGIDRPDTPARHAAGLYGQAAAQSKESPAQQGSCGR